jgi:hypothetical protein
MEKQNINNANFVKPTLTFQTHKIKFLVSMILPDTTSPQYESVQIHAYNKDVRYMCLFGHVVGTSSHIYGVELAQVIQLLCFFRLLAPAKQCSAGVER